ncbi:MAG: outer membrane protein transport protein [bacterium]
MRKGIFLGVVGLVLFGQVSSSFGSAYEGAGLGARQRIMGGAFIGMADDWTAIYWNPAGLAKQDTKGAGIEFDYVVLEGEDGDSVANRLITKKNSDQGDVFFQFGTEPFDKFNKKDILVHTFLPGVGGYTPFKDVVIAAGIYEPIGYASKWNDAKAGITADYEIEAYEIVYNLSIAKQINPNLSLGAGLNLLQGKYKKYAKKDVPPGMGTYTYSIEVDGDGFGFEQVIGLMYKIKPNIDIGAVYRTGDTVKLKGTGKAKHTHPLMNVDESSDYTQRFEHPPTYGIGLAFRPQPKLVITTDWARTDWTTMRSHIDYDTPDQILLKDIPTRDVDWKATDRFRIGAEYQLNDIWTIRGGIFTDPSPVPDKAVSLTNVIDVDFTYFGLGLGYAYKDCRIDFGMLLADNDRDAEGVHYEKKSTSYLVGGVCKF